MFHPHRPYFYFNLLQDQHRYYTDLLNEFHRTLGRQYERLAKVDVAIAQRHENNLVRKQKKQLQWSQAKTKKLIQDIERQQWYLQDWIRQIEQLVNPYTSATPTQPVPQLPYPVTPFSTIPTVPPTMIGEYEGPTKYWDLSMLRERGGSAASVPSADSGFYEPSVFTQTVPYDVEGVSPFANIASPLPQARQGSFGSENDTVAELGMSVSPMKVSAEPNGSRHHQRRYSENAIQLIESRLATSKGHSRVRSVEEIPMMDRGL